MSRLIDYSPQCHRWPHAGRGENGLSVTVSAQRATDSDPANRSEQGTAGGSMNFEPGNSGEQTLHVDRRAEMPGNDLGVAGRDCC
jgi:hypothetical protein